VADAPLARRYRWDHLVVPSRRAERAVYRQELVVTLMSANGLSFLFPSPLVPNPFHGIWTMFPPRPAISAAPRSGPKVALLRPISLVS
jgi:hypothetical protein